MAGCFRQHMFSHVVWIYWTHLSFTLQNLCILLCLVQVYIDIKLVIIDLLSSKTHWENASIRHIYMAVHYIVDPPWSSSQISVLSRAKLLCYNTIMWPANFDASKRVRTCCTKTPITSRAQMPNRNARGHNQYGLKRASFMLLSESILRTNPFTTKVQASNPTLKSALDEYHREKLTDNKVISQRLAAEHGIHMQWVRHLVLLCGLGFWAHHRTVSGLQLLNDVVPSWDCLAVVNHPSSSQIRTSNKWSLKSLTGTHQSDVVCIISSSALLATEVHTSYGQFPCY